MPTLREGGGHDSLGAEYASEALRRRWSSGEPLHSRQPRRRLENWEGVWFSNFAQEDV